MIISLDEIVFCVSSIYVINLCIVKRRMNTKSKVIDLQIKRLEVILDITCFCKKYKTLYDIKTCIWQYYWKIC